MSAASSPGKHILVINDVPELLDLFCDLLGEEGYRVTVDRFAAMGLTEQLERIKACAPDLVVLDFLIGGEPLGWQLLQMMKLDRATARIPVVVCTAAVDTVKAAHAHLVNMDVEAILKPFDIDQLLAAIERAFARAATNAANTDGII